MSGNETKEEQINRIMEAMGYKPPTLADTLLGVLSGSIRWIWIGVCVGIGWRISGGL